MPDLLIKRRDPTSFEVRDSVKPTIVAGQVVLALDRFGLTSNNLTYALTGSAMGYWRYFPADQGWGRMPVWGFADVVETAAEGLPAGTRLFGLFPPSSYAVLEPGPSHPWGIEDISPHRDGLPQVYNTYLRTDGDPLYAEGSEDRLAVVRILFLTAFLLVDHIQAASDSAPVDAVILSSASSKTALAVAHELRQREHATVIGLTSSRNEEFVRGSGAYEEVVEYERIAELSPASAVYVDFAGTQTSGGKFTTISGDGCVAASWWVPRTGSASAMTGSSTGARERRRRGVRTQPRPAPRSHTGVLLRRGSDRSPRRRFWC